jgi:hypothetical protein
MQQCTAARSHNPEVYTVLKALQAGQRSIAEFAGLPCVNPNRQSSASLSRASDLRRERSHWRVVDSNERRRAEREMASSHAIRAPLWSWLGGLGVSQTNANRCGVVEMNIGKWYDPISERWFVPRDMVPIVACPQPCERDVMEIRRRTAEQRTEAQRIWRLLVDCCAHG